MGWNKIKAFWPYLAGYRREMAVGIMALLVTDLAGLVIPWLLKEFIDLLPKDPSGSTLVKYSGWLVLAAGVQALSRFGWRKFLFGPSRKVEFDILNRLFSHLLTLDKFFFQQHKIGDLMSRATNDLRAVRDFAGLGLLILVDSTVVIISCVCLMSVINPGLTLLVLVPLPLISILFFNFVREISRRHQAVQEHLAGISSFVQENLAGIRVLHAFAQEENERKKFDALNREYIQKNLRVTKLFGIFTPSLVFTIGLASMISLWIGGKAVIQNEMSLGAFVAFNGYLMMLSWPMMGIGYVVNLTQKGLSALARIREIFSVQPIIKDGDIKGESGELKGAVEYRNLSFTYPGSKSEGLHRIDLTIPQGHRLAIVGSIGSGKSTLAQMLPRLLQANPKSVWVGGRAVEDIPLRLLRGHIGYVDQEPFLFSMSIRENIVLGNPGAEPGEVDEVVRCAGLIPDLSRFPQGLETMVGERGVSLSGGQKQRIALARALLKKPGILVLDDAFSSLDVETEGTILENIRDRLKTITTLFITHRLSLARQADGIVVLDHGRIVEQGTHRDLVRAGGIYSRMFKNQALAREMEITL
ncbi:MAG: ABC transporter ATP-binding protein [Nitrospinaceae bacterium]